LKAAAPFFFALLPLAAVSTLSHELGHMAMAWLVGVRPILHYNYTTWTGNMSVIQRYWVTAAGPLTTWLISGVGLLLLYRRYTLTRLMAALFCLRMPVNAILFLLGLARTGYRQDEVRIALRLGLPEGSLLYVSTLVAFSILLLVLNRIPDEEFQPTIIGGTVGGLAGAALWYGLLGPWLLP